MWLGEVSPLLGSVARARSGTGCWGRGVTAQLRPLYLFLDSRRRQFLVQKNSNSPEYRVKKNNIKPFYRLKYKRLYTYFHRKGRSFTDLS